MGRCTSRLNPRPEKISGEISIDYTFERFNANSEYTEVKQSKLNLKFKLEVQRLIDKREDIRCIAAFDDQLQKVERMIGRILREEKTSGENEKKMVLAAIIAAIWFGKSSCKKLFLPL